MNLTPHRTTPRLLHILRSHGRHTRSGILYSKGHLKGLSKLGSAGGSFAHVAWRMLRPLARSVALAVNRESAAPSHLGEISPFHKESRLTPDITQNLRESFPTKRGFFFGLFSKVSR